jgi:hypothetical protein
MKTLSLLATSALLMLGGCCTTTSTPLSLGIDDSPGSMVVVTDCGYTTRPLWDANYTATAYRAIDVLLSNANRPGKSSQPFDPSRPVLYSTTVDLNDYTATTDFGRLISESFATAMTQHGVKRMIKSTLRENFQPIIPQNGEFLLSRDVEDLAKSFNAGAVLLSTYSVSIDRVYLSMQLVNVDHNFVCGAVQFNIPLGPRTMAMLKNQGFPEPDMFADSGAALPRGNSR